MQRLYQMHRVKFCKCWAPTAYSQAETATLKLERGNQSTQAKGRWESGRVSTVVVRLMHIFLWDDIRRVEQRMSTNLAQMLPELMSRQLARKYF